MAENGRDEKKTVEDYTERNRIMNTEKTKIMVFRRGERKKEKAEE